MKTSNVFIDRQCWHISTSRVKDCLDATGHCVKLTFSVLVRCNQYTRMPPAIVDPDSPHVHHHIKPDMESTMN